MWAGLASPAWATTITPTVIHEGETLTFTFDVSGTPLIGSGSHSIDYSGTAAKTTDYVVGNPSRGIIVTTAGEHLPDKRDVSYIDGVSFSADAPSITFEIEAKADDLDEGDETVNINHEFGRATVTIKDGPRPSSEPLPTPTLPVASFDAAASSADEDAGTVKVAVTLSPAPASAITLAYTVGGTATAGSGQDFTIAGSGRLRVPAGATHADIAVAVTDDAVDEAAETVVLTLGSGTGYRVGGTAVHTLTIADNDDTPVVAPERETQLGEAVRPSVSITAGPAVTEGGDATFTLTATPAPAGDLPVRVEIGRERDYVAQGDLGTRTVTIPAGKSSAAFTVATVDDDRPEMTGRVTARIEGGEDVDYVPATAPDDTARMRVHDNDTLFIRVSNARVRERPGARLAFRVRLSGARPEPVRVRYATRDVTAAAGEDYRRKSGKLTFAPGETEKTVWIRVFDDAHDEGRETLELELSKARGSRIRDGARFGKKVGVGTIVNADPMPKAWLARFGRTAAEQALHGIAGRLEASRAPAVEGRLAGQSLAPAGAADRRFRDGANGDRHDPFGHGLSDGTSRTMTAREAFPGSSFSLTGETDGAGGTLAFWGRAAHATFDGTDKDLSLDGEVITGLLGMDYARGRWTLGLALAQSAGEGGYSLAEGDSGGGPGSASGAGKVESSLAAAVPWAAWRASRRLTLWGAAGHGAGEMMLTPEDETAKKTDIDWSMAAAGARGALVEPASDGPGSGSGAGPTLDLVSDALWTRTASEKAANLAPASARTTRLRLGLEAGWRVALEGGGAVVPKLSAGARQDGGDAETGFGVELGGGIAWTDPALGLKLDVEGRTLLAHEADGLKDRGFSAGLAFDPDPATQRGPSLTLRQDWGGQANGGLDALFAPDPLEDRSGSEEKSRWTVEGAWGFPAFGNRFTGSPHAAVGLATRTRDYTVGWRLTPAAAPSAGAAQAAAPDLSFGLRATRGESDTAAREHRVGIEVRARW